MKQRVLVTGAGGLLGHHLLPLLKDYEVFATHRGEGDLRELSVIQSWFQKHRPDIVIHLAATCGGVKASKTSPGTAFYDNAVMGIQLIEECRKTGVKKVIVFGTVCCYPKDTIVPFREDTLWEGYPEESNAPYGIAKRMLLTHLRAYREQYGLNGIFLIPINFYGPHDNFDPDHPNGIRFIPMLIRKFSEVKDSGEKSVTLMGDKNAFREFLYVGDCAEAVVMAMEKYDGVSPVNIGTGNPVLVSRLAEMIAEQVGYKGEILWKGDPDGHPVKSMDVNKAREFGFYAKTSIEDGIRKTIQFYNDRAMGCL